MQINRISFNFLCFSCLLLLNILFYSFNKAHPYYVSLTEIHIDSTSRALNVSCRMFTDDLQDAIYKLYQQKLDFDIPGNEATKKAVLEKYLKERLRIVIGTEVVSLDFSGFEVEEESVWCYLEGNFKNHSSKIEIKNSVLYDFLPGQANMMHCYLQEARKSFKLNNPEMHARFEFLK